MPRKPGPTKMKKKNNGAVAGPGPAVPTSPPQTPRSSSPPSKQADDRAKGRPGAAAQEQQNQQEKRGQVPPHYRFSTRPTAGNGFNFSDYHPDSFRREQLSPRSSAESSDSDAESSGSDCPPRSHSSTESIKPSARPPPRQRTPAQDDVRRRAWPPPPSPAAKTPFVAARIIVESAFEFVESDGSEDEDCIVLLPDAIEYAESERSRSRSRPRQDDDRKMASDMRNLNVFTSDDEDEDQDEWEKNILKMREANRRKRMSSGSIGKRTISERGSDSDREDLLFHGMVNAAGQQESGEMRRMRRRLCNRHSLQFQDPPPPRIDEMDEPDSSEELLDSELLARELPFYDYVSMEIDSS